MIVGQAAKGILIVLLLSLVAFCTRPWVLFDGIDRFTYVDSNPRSMIPDVFSDGESRASVETKLAASRYIHDPIDMPDYDENETCGDLLCERAKDGYTDFYRKFDVTAAVTCRNDFIVWLEFDDSDRLKRATNGVYNSCI